MRQEVKLKHTKYDEQDKETFRLGLKPHHTPSKARTHLSLMLVNTLNNMIKIER